MRVRGVLEPKAFDPAKCPPLFMGDNVPMRVCKCVDPACIPNESGFNWMQLNISAPKQRYYMNNAKDSVSHRVEIVDGQFDLEVRGQAEIEYFFDNLNTGENPQLREQARPGAAVRGRQFLRVQHPARHRHRDAGAVTVR